MTHHAWLVREVLLFSGKKLLAVFFPFLPTVFTTFDVVLQTLTCKDWDMFVLYMFMFVLWRSSPEDFECDTGFMCVLLQMAAVTLWQRFADIEFHLWELATSAVNAHSQQALLPACSWGAPGS